jgi:hypothetical protein
MRVADRFTDRVVFSMWIKNLQPVDYMKFDWFYVHVWNTAPGRRLNG